MEQITNIEDNIENVENNIESVLDINIYPNPTSDRFLISLPYSDSVIKLNLIDIHGKTLKYVESNEGLEVIDVTDLSSGIYIVQAIIADKIITKKVQIVK